LRTEHLRTQIKKQSLEKILSSNNKRKNKKL
jgi:hypothetical protein